MVLAHLRFPDVLLPVGSKNIQAFLDLTLSKRGSLMSLLFSYILHPYGHFPTHLPAQVAWQGAIVPATSVLPEDKGKQFTRRLLCLSWWFSCSSTISSLSQWSLFLTESCLKIPFKWNVWVKHREQDGGRGGSISTGLLRDITSLRLYSWFDVLFAVNGFLFWKLFLSRCSGFHCCAVYHCKSQEEGEREGKGEEGGGEDGSGEYGL